MTEVFIERRFQKRTLKSIEQINDILEEYAEQGLTMTIRQLFYQMVSRDIIPFDNGEYQKLIDLDRDQWGRNVERQEAERKQIMEAVS